MDEYNSWKSRYAMLRYVVNNPCNFEEVMLLMRQFYRNHDTNNVPLDIRQIYALLMEKFPDHHETLQQQYPYKHFMDKFGSQVIGQTQFDIRCCERVLKLWLWLLARL